MLYLLTVLTLKTGHITSAFILLDDIPSYCAYIHIYSIYEYLLLSFIVYINILYAIKQLNRDPLNVTFYVSAGHITIIRSITIQYHITISGMILLMIVMCPALA